VTLEEDGAVKGTALSNTASPTPLAADTDLVVVITYSDGVLAAETLNVRRQPTIVAFPA